MYQQKKEKFIRVLNNHFGSYNVFPEVANISDEDFIKIIELYEQKASMGGKDPWNYLYFDELIIMQQCLYEVIKDNYRYRDITAKVEVLFEQELNRRLQRSVRSYGEETDETYRASYAEMPEYAMTLADMCTRKMETAQKSFAESKEVVLPERSLSTYKEIRKDFTTAGIQMPEKSESIAQSTQTLITLRAEEKEALIERERQQREIELITLQQEINRIENEKLEIEKRIRQISSETIGSFFSRQVSEKYPTEYQTYQQHKEQVKNHRSSYEQITDLKEKFSQVSQELQFYQGVLPAYESFYQRFKQMKVEREKAQASEKEQERIYNLIYSEENERLRKSNSLYTAWDLGNKVIPQKYQGLSYEQVEEMITQEREQERLKQLAQATREDLINKAIRKDLGVAEDYHLSDVQIRNLRVEFDGYSDEELRDFIAGVKKETPVQQSVDNGTRKLEPVDFSSLLEESENKVQRTHLINEILEAMYPNGLEYVPLPDIKKQLEAKSTEELQAMLQQLNSQTMEETSAKKR